MLKRILWIIALLVLLIGALSLLPGRAGMLQDPDTRMYLVYFGLLLAYLMLSPKLMENMPTHTMVRYAVIWVGIFLVGLVGYSFKDPLMAILMPDIAQEKKINSQDSVLTVRAAPDGHFYVTADVEGVPIRFMIDTGATHVSLTYADAKRIGHQPAPSDFTQQSMTANGPAMSAALTLNSITIRDLRINNVRASVMKEQPGISLLGLSFLSRLKSWTVQGDTLEMVGGE